MLKPAYTIRKAIIFSTYYLYLIRFVLNGKIIIFFRLLAGLARQQKLL